MLSFPATHPPPCDVTCYLLDIPVFLLVPCKCWLSAWDAFFLNYNMRGTSSVPKMHQEKEVDSYGLQSWHNFQHLFSLRFVYVVCGGRGPTNCAHSSSWLRNAQEFLLLMFRGLYWVLGSNLRQMHVRPYLL